MENKHISQQQSVTRLRGNLGLSQEEFASFLGIGQSHLSRIESGERPVSKRLRKLLRRLSEEAPAQ
jgi:transcriptional regulator with XRE-family HTH domain